MSARVLFVTNGHGEAAIAERIALELLTFAPAARIDHLALVGNVSSDAMRAVGPRRAMPSGGLIAMGNVRNLAKDLSAGLLSLTLSQARFLRRARGAYDVVVAVGDAFALMGPAGVFVQFTYGLTDGSAASLAQVIVHAVPGAKVPPVANDDVAPAPDAGAVRHPTIRSA